MSFLIAVSLVACATQPLPPPDTGRDEWTVQRGQAVWRPRRGAPEIAGDLVLAMGPSGDFVLEFSKPPLALVAGHRTGGSWQIEFPTEGRRIRGRGSGTDRLLWLRLPDALATESAQGSVRFSRPNANAWRLENARTGEWVEGFLSP